MMTLKNNTLTGRPAPDETLPNRAIPRGQDDLQLRDGLFPVHSPLLGESQLFSFPPLINMLKLSG